MRTPIEEITYTGIFNGGVLAHDATGSVSVPALHGLDSRTEVITQQQAIPAPCKGQTLSGLRLLAGRIRHVFVRGGDRVPGLAWGGGSKIRQSHG